MAEIGKKSRVDACISLLGGVHTCSSYSEGITEKITAALASAAYGDLTDEDYSNFAFSEYWFNVILQKIRQYKTVGYL